MTERETDKQRETPQKVFPGDVCVPSPSVLILCCLHFVVRLSPPPTPHPLPDTAPSIDAVCRQHQFGRFTLDQQERALSAKYRSDLTNINLPKLCPRCLDSEVIVPTVTLERAQSYTLTVDRAINAQRKQAVSYSVTSVPTALLSTGVAFQ